MIYYIREYSCLSYKKWKQIIYIGVTNLKYVKCMVNFASIFLSTIVYLTNSTNVRLTNDVGIDDEG